MMEIIMLSLAVSGTAVALATLMGVPFGAYLGFSDSRLAQWITRIIYTLMGLPPVVAGLVIYMLLRSKGPFGVLDLLFTPTAMIIAQTVLVFPIVSGISMVGIREKDREIRDTAITLGASGCQAVLAVIKEARFTILGAVVAGFGRAVAEVGAVMMVGGNIEGYTRVMTTAIVLETRKGNFEFAIGLGLVLLIIAFMVNSVFYHLQNGVKRY
ncbi:MAG: ABC transporter permease [Peptococcaceae bacterium]|nr:ABC transporter permease [Peptococcaceae bacterium]